MLLHQTGIHSYRSSRACPRALRSPLARADRHPVAAYQSIMLPEVADPESEVGISAYANDLPGFSAILKQRYTDFKVNEVDVDGNVVHLTSLQLPAVGQADSGGKKPDTPTAEAGADAPASSGPSEEQLASLFAEFAELAGSANCAALRDFHAEILSCQAAAGKQPDGRPAVPDPISLDVADADKAKRTALHQFLKREGWPAWQSEAVSSAVQPQDGSSNPGSTVSSIRLTYVGKGQKGGRAGSNSRRDRRNDWPGGSRSFTRCVLYKENLETQAALGMLGRMLHCKPGTLGIAGTKDKRSVSAQHLTAWQVTPQRLAGLNGHLRGVRLGNFDFCAEGLFLGGARGNRFELVLREVECEQGPAAVARAAQAVGQQGFINFYGLQRFGSGGVPTHRVGIALLKGQWEEAVRLIMQPSSHERADSAAAKQLFLNQADIPGALKAMPRHCVAECAILEGLQKHAAKGQKGRPDYVGALSRIPRNLRTMYIHAYQSWLWNSAASARCEQHGFSAPVQGDLVLPGGPDGLAERADGDDSMASKQRPVVLSAAEAASGRYSNCDIVLPLPGSSIIYPDNDTEQVYHRLAKEQGIDLQGPAPHAVKDFSLSQLPGAYRRLVVRPASPSFQLLRYWDPQADLAHTDLDLLEGRGAQPLQCQRLDMQGEPTEPLASGIAPPKTPLLALQMAFQLPSAAYATMLVRELTKRSTSTAVHQAMTQTAAKPVEAASHAAAAAASSGPVDAQPTHAHATQPREGNDEPANVAADIVSEGATGQQSSPGAASPGRGLAPDTAKHVLDLEGQPSAKKQRQ